MVGWSGGRKEASGRSIRPGIPGVAGNRPPVQTRLMGKRENTIDIFYYAGFRRPVSLPWKRPDSVGVPPEASAVAGGRRNFIENPAMAGARTWRIRGSGPDVPRRSGTRRRESGGFRGSRGTGLGTTGNAARSGDANPRPSSEPARLNPRNRPESPGFFLMSEPSAGRRQRPARSGGAAGVRLTRYRAVPGKNRRSSLATGPVASAGFCRSGKRATETGRLRPTKPADNGRPPCRPGTTVCRGEQPAGLRRFQRLSGAGIRHRHIRAGLGPDSCHRARLDRSPTAIATESEPGHICSRGAKSPGFRAFSPIQLDRPGSEPETPLPAWPAGTGWGPTEPPGAFGFGDAVPGAAGPPGGPGFGTRGSPPRRPRIAGDS